MLLNFIPSSTEAKSIAVMGKFSNGINGRQKVIHMYLLTLRKENDDGKDKWKRRQNNQNKHTWTHASSAYILVKSTHGQDNIISIFTISCCTVFEQTVEGRKCSRSASKIIRQIKNNNVSFAYRLKSVNCENHFTYYTFAIC